MKQFFLVLLGLSQFCNAFSQQKKIKVYLLGTFHFLQTDTNTYDVRSPQHQASISRLAKLIIRTKPDKVFIERMPEFEHMNRMDSLYQEYRQGNLSRARNEIWQIAGRVAAALNHPHIYQCDQPGQYGMWYERIAEYASKNGQEDKLARKGKGMTLPVTSLANQDSLRQSMDLLEFMRWLNSDEVQHSSHASYINVFPQLGNTDVFHYDPAYFLGTELTADWYRRNILTYAKMLAQLDYSENAIFLIIGNDHIPIIRQLFEANPYFEVISAKKWLGRPKFHLPSAGK